MIRKLAGTAALIAVGVTGLGPTFTANATSARKPCSPSYGKLIGNWRHQFDAAGDQFHVTFHKVAARCELSIGHGEAGTPILHSANVGGFEFTYNFSQHPNRINVTVIGTAAQSFNAHRYRDAKPVR